ncbi:eukaryotic translation initiation factor 3 subunit A [Parasteatoda tepidariorum]|uniref:eukaryotic translation initiation factor 3 subunit A n=1 Tax=Parasteatoda tepidariorum TaxID=114398 RepID=UPI00077F9AF0|nr:eukaryotic translation initiation factor 3 subunit A [Parasteatoda tepidariorum]
MPQYFQRPENALKRANEFIDVGKKQRALDALCDVIKSRKHRTWQKIHEPIMSKYLGLCVELKKSHVAKEGLFQYRNICQQVNIKSLEDVVRGYLALAEEKTESAREESQQVVVDIDDLDQVQTPENLLLSAVSSEDTQDRTDRVVLTPWVKFLWESYRHCLELLRNNSRVERLYHDIAQQAFRFCLKYNRKTEFRKLCDNLRAHLGHIHKHQNQQTSVNLNNPESQAMHLETRLVQLDSAIQMELWQEAYKAIEDIHGLMSLSKKAPNPRLMANYYQKLALVFWKSNNYLFHAAALFRLFYLSREQKKNITADEILKMASRVVLATLAVPMPPIRSDIDRLVETDENVIDKNHRLLSTLLGLPNPPTRALLIKDLVRFGIIQSAPSQLQDLYRWLETEFHPLKLCSRVQQSFELLIKWEEFPELRQYIPSIQEITVVRLVKEVSQVYQTIKFSRLLELAPFVKPFDLEYLVVEIARRNDLQVRIDHRKECFHFGSELNVSQREEIIEGPQLQSMPSEQMRNQLVYIHSVLNKAVNYLLPDKKKLERKELSKEIVKAYMHTSSKDHMRILNRQQIIEERKEMLENLNYQKEVEERKLLEDKHQKLREAEKERMARETEERTKQRLLREQSEMKRKVVMEKIEQLKKTEIGSKIFDGMDEEELEKLDPDDLLHKHVEQLDRERKELQAKLRKQERKVDHLERAKRIEEVPLLLAEYDEHKAKDKDFWEQHEKERITTIIEERALAVQYRDRLMRLKDDRDKFLDRLKKARASVYQEKLAEFEKVLTEERKKRLEERKQKRKEERRLERIKLQEEKKQQMIAEAMKREREEALAKLEEMEAKKRAKEKEIEERLKREKLELEKKQEEERTALRNKEKPLETTRPASNWREREQLKKESWGPRDDRTNRDDRSSREDRPLRDDRSSREKSGADNEARDWRSRAEGAASTTEDRDWKKPKEDTWRRDEKPATYQRPAFRDDLRSDSSRDRRDREETTNWRSAAPAARREGDREVKRYPESQRDKDRSDGRDRGLGGSNFSRDRDSYRRDDTSDRRGEKRDGFGSRNEGSGGYRSRNDGPGGYSSRGDGFGSRNEGGSDKAPEGGSWRSGGGGTSAGGSWRSGGGGRENEDRSDRKPAPRGDFNRSRDKPREPDDDGFVPVRR